MIPPERSPERDAALLAALPRIAGQGWTFSALRAGLTDAGTDPREAEVLFPGGGPEMIEAFLDLADRQMLGADLTGLRTGARVRGLVAARLAWAHPYKDACRRAAALLALPRNLRLAARCTARTADAIWHAAGDTSADFSWYTKRATLAAVYSATLLYWLRDASEDGTATLEFLDRRLAGVARIGKIRKRAEGTFGRMRGMTGAQGAGAQGAGA